MNDTILCISGSARSNSSNRVFLQHLATIDSSKDLNIYDGIHSLPIFSAQLDPIPSSVLEWRKHIKAAKGLIICTPEYLHNQPAVIKNALEWLTSSGELFHKPVIPITYTPNVPRGEKAMTSLCWSLTALDAKILPSIALYQTELPVVAGQIVMDEFHLALLEEALKGI